MTLYTVFCLIIVLILPMRNGNSKYLYVGWTETWSSYPTYEEWKLTIMLFNPFCVTCSYPTYEEWKQEKEDIIDVLDDSSYPTYEEWKPEFVARLNLNFNCVLILPMRNGNKED